MVSSGPRSGVRVPGSALPRALPSSPSSTFVGRCLLPASARSVFRTKLVAGSSLEHLSPPGLLGVAHEAGSRGLRRAAQRKKKRRGRLRDRADLLANLELNLRGGDEDLNLSAEGSGRGDDRLESAVGRPQDR